MSRAASAAAAAPLMSPGPSVTSLREAGAGAAALSAGMRSAASGLQQCCVPLAAVPAAAAAVRPEWGLSIRHGSCAVLAAQPESGAERR